MKTINFILATMAIAGSLTACKSTRQVTVTPEGEVKTETLIQTSDVIHEVLFGEWMVVHVGDLDVTGSDRPYLIFDNEPSNQYIVKCYANDGCNYINGVYAVTPGGKMQRTSEFISTMRMCPDAPYEMGINLALNTVESYKIEQMEQDYLLHFINAEGQTTMTLRKYDLNFVNGAWSVTEIRNTPVSTDKELQIVLDIPELKVHGNTGCNILNGSLSIDPEKQNSLRFENLATTRMACPDMKVEQAFLEALGNVSTVVPGSDNNSAILKDSTGNELISLKRINLK